MLLNAHCPGGLDDYEARAAASGLNAGNEKKCRKSFVLELASQSQVTVTAGQVKYAMFKYDQRGKSPQERQLRESASDYPAFFT